jgi:hypothetical protein
MVPSIQGYQANCCIHVINHLHLSQQFILNFLAVTSRLFGHLQRHLDRSLQPLTLVSSC